MATEIDQLDLLKFLMTLLGDNKIRVVEFNQSNEFTERTDGSYVHRELTGKSTLTIVLDRMN
jgi:hypothetical protein